MLPYLKPEYFEEITDRAIFQLINAYVLKYNGLPSKEALYIDLSNISDKLQDINDEQFETCKTIIDEMQTDELTRLEWLSDETEKFCQDRAMHIALTRALQISSNNEKRSEKGMIPQLLTDALAVSFDSNIGHDYFEDADARYDFYHMQEHKIPLHIDILNTITKGGVSKKSLTILMMGTNVGKSLSMCDFAAHNLQDGKNVLYITLEMAEEYITQRIDANIMDITIDQLILLPKETFTRNIERIRSKTAGKLKVKEYPGASAGSANFRYLLNELRIKQNFIPDIIYIDYLNICISSRFKKGNVGLYEYVGSIAEEIRGLAVEFAVPIITAVQFNREGMKSSNPGMDDVSDSIGIAFTADWIWGGVVTEELERDNQIMFFQLKNRYGDKVLHKKFLVGVDKSKMKLYNVESKEKLTDEAATVQAAKEVFVTPEMEEKLGKNMWDDFK